MKIAKQSKTLRRLGGSRLLVPVYSVGKVYSQFEHAPVRSVASCGNCEVAGQLRGETLFIFRVKTFPTKKSFDAEVFDATSYFLNGPDPLSIELSTVGPPAGVSSRDFARSAAAQAISCRPSVLQTE
ncbi:hypothetical protein EVAR_80083_1 [Eumeta japonica]|uniref:Uncharacterized protein n=1 Tax=Eumeta variegata TaxID=151549 RepID=A0A4C1UDM7_EUMVA|nr:hypothetical protein EVAR_80083_1 [Eumeta japonica]